jgi:hypothetical protein
MLLFSLYSRRKDRTGAPSNIATLTANVHGSKVERLQRWFAINNRHLELLPILAAVTETAKLRDLAPKAYMPSWHRPSLGAPGVVGAYSWTGGQTNEGGAWVYHGADTAEHGVPDWHAEDEQASNHFGTALACAGDGDGDAYADGFRELRRRACAVPGVHRLKAQDTALAMRRQGFEFRWSKS